MRSGIMRHLICVQMRISGSTRYGYEALAWKRLYLRECKTPCPFYASWTTDATFFRRHVLIVYAFL